jgi:hypothetical protein
VIFIPCSGCFLLSNGNATSILCVLKCVQVIQRSKQLGDDSGKDEMKET